MPTGKFYDGGYLHMKIVIAPDSFKDSISARDAARAIAEGLSSVFGDSAEILTLPIADGGEGTLDALTPPDARVHARVSGPLRDPVDACYGRAGDTAVIEMASAAGLMLVESAQRCAARTTTLGVGELIRRAWSDGFRRVLLTVGGSATNDGGCGMLAALGAIFTDRNGQRFLPTGGTLSEIASIDLADAREILESTRFTIATDVKNPLLGASGATAVYAPQKGATDGELSEMERGMAHYASLLCQMSGREIASTPGVGAGGGIAAPLVAFADAELRSGIETVLSVNRFSEALCDADAVITGEGKIDRQSLWGKAISGVARAAGERGIPVYCFVGRLGDNRAELLAMGLADILEVRARASSTEDAMQNAARYLTDMGGELAHRLSSK
jgi:glycerate kinase